MSFFNQTQTNSNVLVSFRAGKMNKSGNLVSPDKRKGMVQVVKSPEGIVQFQWKDRVKGDIVDNFFLFPGDAVLKKVYQCTTGRVVLLRFNQGRRRFFYWLQEPKEDKDQELLDNVNKAINGEVYVDPKSSKKISTATTSSTGKGKGDEKEKKSTNTQNQSQNLIPDLGNIIGNLQSEMEKMQNQKPVPHLVELLKPERIGPLLQENEDLKNRLIEFLPLKQRSSQDIDDFIHSPQYLQALNRLEYAISTLPPQTIFTHFGLEGGDQNQMGVAALFDSLLKMEQKKEKKEKDEKNEKNEKDMDIEESEKN
ncbi:adhesion regulating molecule 1 110 kda cell membrane glycoprotein [Anaeramoeba flamelloides]|uniref:Adhesion regulating molecule 1 110 kDa cell membrane glycoprotein n=1 Tax=Anaeramoeba flamelloides TaxID=1746091 RepID=A0AAV7Z384_9EUKA|nr:adhesion regulating molecule 1 110 kda cell membrane glycoprotein [Anaeramoeba flamelloides]